MLLVSTTNPVIPSPIPVVLVLTTSILEVLEGPMLTLLRELVQRPPVVLGRLARARAGSVTGDSWGRLCRPGIGLPVLRLKDVEEGMIFMTGCIYMRGCERACMESGRGDTTKKMQKK